MYAGHAAVALALKARVPRLPIVPLALACFGPDWIEAALMIPHPREGMAPYTHSIPAVVLGGSVAALLYRAVARGPGAWYVLLGWLLHWPADFLTGRKPLIGITPLVGEDLYRLPYVDFTLESVLIIAGCALYARTFARTRRQRAWVIAMGAALVLLQLGLDSIITRSDPSPWTPTLAKARERPHLVSHAVRTSLARG